MVITTLLFLIFYHIPIHESSKRGLLIVFHSITWNNVVCITWTISKHTYQRTKLGQQTHILIIVASLNVKFTYHMETSLDSNHTCLGMDANLDDKYTYHGGKHGWQLHIISMEAGLGGNQHGSLANGMGNVVDSMWMHIS